MTAGLRAALSHVDTPDYCRQIEAYLCQKNDGHLIRIVGPSFELVSGWARLGVPFKVACQGIDRYFERYYRKGPRRRPVRIDFCDADVLEVFDEWRRATGLTSASVAETDGGADGGGRRGPSLRDHLQRVLLRLTNARVTGALGPRADGLIDRVSTELDRVRQAAGGLRGDARRLVLERLAEADAELLSFGKESLGQRELEHCSRQAEEELAGFRDRMDPEAFSRAREAAVSRLVRERLGLPTIALS